MATEKQVLLEEEAALGMLTRRYFLFQRPSDYNFESSQVGEDLERGT